MKKSVLVMTLLVLSVLIAGCMFLPGNPEDAVSGGGVESVEEGVESPDNTETPAAPEAVAEDIIAQVVEQETQKEEVLNDTNETDIVVELDVSGSLDLQRDTSLCPHLAQAFQCDKYDIRRCGFKTFVGKNDFYPDLMNCREGDPAKGENKQNRYCLIQECAPLQKDNLVYAYGGIISYAEYMYSEQKTDGGIMTRYELTRCGESAEEFESEFECTVYKAELDGLWVD